MTCNQGLFAMAIHFSPSQRFLGVTICSNSGMTLLMHPILYWLAYRSMAWQSPRFSRKSSHTLMFNARLPIFFVLEGEGEKCNRLDRLLGWRYRDIGHPHYDTNDTRHRHHTKCLVGRGGPSTMCTVSMIIPCEGRSNASSFLGFL